MGPWLLCLIIFARNSGTYKHFSKAIKMKQSSLLLCMCFIDISKAETGLKVRTLIIIPSQPPLKIRDVAQRGGCWRGLFALERGTFWRNNGQRVHVFAFCTHCGRGYETNGGWLLGKDQFSLFPLLHSHFQVANGLGCFLSAAELGKDKLDSVGVNDGDKHTLTLGLWFCFFLRWFIGVVSLGIRIWG